MFKAQKRSSGFTLIELMITIVILAIFAAIALPNLGNLVEKRRVIRVAEQVQDALITARLEAVKQSREITFRFCPPVGNSSNWRLGFTTDSSQNCTSTGEFFNQVSSGTDGENFPRVNFTLTENTTQTPPTTADTITFSPLGTISNIDQGIAQPTIRTDDERWQLTVKTNLIGRVTVCSPTAASSPGRYSVCD